MKIAIASDHAGYELKAQLIEHLKTLNFEVADLGPFEEGSVDYPDYAHKLAKSVVAAEADYGIAICGSGNGINMTVNKYQEIRAALCWTPEISALARQHNNANVLSIPARFVSVETAIEIVNNFFNTDFEGGRHLNRVNKISCA